MEPENWSTTIIIVIAGAILGYALPYIIKFIQFIWSFVSRKELLEGDWHVYHFTREQGKTFTRYEKWMIKRNFLNQLIVTTEDPRRPDLKYKGDISVEKNYLLIRLNGVMHPEKVQMRFFDIIPTEQDIAYGLAMGVDFDNKPQCLVRIMSREELSEEKAREILSSKTKYTRPGIIGIKT